MFFLSFILGPPSSQLPSYPIIAYIDSGAFCQKNPLGFAELRSQTLTQYGVKGDKSAVHIRIYLEKTPLVWFQVNRTMVTLSIRFESIN